MIKDIFIIFFICIGLVWLVDKIPKKNENQKPEFLNFAGTSEKNTNVSFNQKTPEEKSADNSKKIKRSFTWVDSEEKKRETVFFISKKILKKEIRRFGVPHGGSHPFFLKRRGFKVIDRMSINEQKHPRHRALSIVDYKQIFERNLQYFQQFSIDLAASAELSKDKDPLHAFLLFVQHISYKLPPRFYHGKFINFFFVPLVCLYEQYGDCDSKALLLADLLGARPSSKDKLALVLIRGQGLSHALLAIKRKPLPGMTSLHFLKKGYYIVLETSIPGWAPGFISQRVTNTMKAGLFTFEDLN